MSVVASIANYAMLALEYCSCTQLIRAMVASTAGFCDIFAFLTISLTLTYSRACTQSYHSSNLYIPTWKGPSMPYTDPVMIQHARYLINSYHEIMKDDRSGLAKDLIPEHEISSKDEINAEKLFHLRNRVVLSHGIQPGPPEGEGPILNYGR